MTRIPPSVRKTLLSNPNVLKITENHVVFTPGFKLKAVELSQQGIPGPVIFEMHRINPKLFKDNYCGRIIRKWRAIADKKGKETLQTENRGRNRLHESESMDGYSVEELKAIIAIQEEMLNAIKKKKALAQKK